MFPDAVKDYETGHCNLGDHGCNGSAGHTFVQNHHKQDIKENIHGGGDEDSVKGSLAVTHCP